MFSINKPNIYTILRTFLFLLTSIFLLFNLATIIYLAIERPAPSDFEFYPRDSIFWLLFFTFHTLAQLLILFLPRYYTYHNSIQRGDNYTTLALDSVSQLSVPSSSSSSSTSSSPTSSSSTSSPSSTSKEDALSYRTVLTLLITDAFIFLITILFFIWGLISIANHTPWTVAGVDAPWSSLRHSSSRLHTPAWCRSHLLTRELRAATIVDLECEALHANVWGGTLIGAGVVGGMLVGLGWKRLRKGRRREYEEMWEDRG